MYSDWDQKNEIRRSPVDRDGLSTWLTEANDDAGNARPALVASKNVFLPDQREIASLGSAIVRLPISAFAHREWSSGFSSGLFGSSDCHERTHAEIAEL